MAVYLLFFLEASPDTEVRPSFIVRICIVERSPKYASSLTEVSVNSRMYNCTQMDDKCG